MKKKEAEKRARYKVVTSEEIDNVWKDTKTEERVLIANKSFWIDCHKYDFSSKHSIVLSSSGKYMLEYRSFSPDGKKCMTYTIIDFI